MKKVTIIGHFGTGENLINGQTIKTKNIYNSLLDKYGEEHISILDTHNWKKHPIKLLLKSIDACKKSENIIILPAHKGIKIFIPLFVNLKKKYKFKLHYITIGSWLYDLTNNKLKTKMKKIDYIYVENKKIKSKFEKIGFNNIHMLLNYKNSNINKSPKKYNNDKKMNMCIFSRIEKEKGILDAIDVTKKLYNHNYNVNLDIYGPIKESFETELREHLINCKCVSYKGIIENNKSSEVLKKYDILLFPTRYFTEGIPGTILDAYFVGLPIISSMWENFDEIIENNITGIGYEIYKNDKLYNTILDVLNDKTVLNSMSENCLKFAQNYLSQNALKELFDNIGDN